MIFDNYDIITIQYHNCKACNNLEMISLLVPDLTMDIIFDKKFDLDECSDIGETPLHIQNDPDLISYLLDKGLNSNARTLTGNTPLHYKKCPRVVELLLKYGSDPNAVNSYGNTPLHKQTDKESVTLLIDAGGDTRGIKNERGNIPRDVNSNVPYQLPMRYYYYIINTILIFLIYMRYIM